MKPMIDIKTFPFQAELRHWTVHEFTHICIMRLIATSSLINPCSPCLSRVSLFLFPTGCKLFGKYVAKEKITDEITLFYKSCNLFCIASMT